MSELDAPERALLALASDAHDPTDADRARVRAALAARLGAAAGLGVGAALGATATAKAATTGAATTAKAVAAGATGLGSTGTGAAVTGGALATKLVVAVALTATVGVGATVGLVRHRSHGPAPAAQTELHGRRTATVANRPLAAAAPDRVQQETAEAAASATPAEQPSTRATAPRRPSPATAARTAEAPARPTSEAPALPAPLPSPAQTSAPEAPSQHSVHDEAPAGAATVSNHRAAPATARRGQACGPARSDLDGPRPELTVADEARLVHDGVRALHDGQAACALSLLDTHAHFYPHGVLAEERDAERAFALADLGRVREARAAAAAFLRAHPTSPLGARLRQRITGLDAINDDTTGGTPHP